MEEQLARAKRRNAQLKSTLNGKGRELHLLRKKLSVVINKRKEILSEKSKAVAVE
eukprot:SAG31_NODE_9518_length_1265_cov_0.927959_1_plen_54_part_10